MNFGFRSIGNFLFECPVCKQKAIISYPSLSVDFNLYEHNEENPNLFDKIENIDDCKDKFSFDENGINYLRLICRKHDKPVYMVLKNKEKEKE